MILQALLFILFLILQLEIIKCIIVACNDQILVWKKLLKRVQN